MGCKPGVLSKSLLSSLHTDHVDDPWPTRDVNGINDLWVCVIKSRPGQGEEEEVRDPDFGPQTRLCPRRGTSTAHDGRG